MMVFGPTYGRFRKLTAQIRSDPLDVARARASEVDHDDRCLEDDTRDLGYATTDQSSTDGH